MAIGTADFTAREKDGFRYHFGLEANATWDLIEPPLLAWLKGRGGEWKNEQTINDPDFKADLSRVNSELIVDPTKMPPVKTVLGL